MNPTMENCSAVLAFLTFSPSPAEMTYRMDAKTIPQTDRMDPAMMSWFVIFTIFPLTPQVIW